MRQKGNKLHDKLALPVGKDAVIPKRKDYPPTHVLRPLILRLFLGPLANLHHVLI